MPVELQIMGEHSDERDIDALAEMLKDGAHRLLQHLGRQKAQLSLVLTDNPTIEQLNEQWRDESRATDVLSFPIEDFVAPPSGSSVPRPLGDIAISVEYADSLVGTRRHSERVAKQLGVDVETLEWSLEDELRFLLIHGLLHLVGHEHADPEDEAEMKRAEKKLWKVLERPND